MKSLYENYHKKSKSQHKIISDNNFTYINILPPLNKCLTKKTIRILDIGCGSGTISLYLANKGYKVRGIDISKKAIQACKDSAKNLNIENVEFEMCEFPKEIPTGKYDLVFFSEVIEHLPNDGLALREIHKLLNPGGILFLSTPSKNAPLYRLGYAKKFDKEVGHLRRYTSEEIEKKLKKTNYLIVNVYKTESILRNFLFLNHTAGSLIRIINKLHLGGFVTIVDAFCCFLTGESQIIIIATRK